VILFLYGTLLDRRTLRIRAGGAPIQHSAQPAILSGWRRVHLRGTPYPTLRRARDEVAGMVVAMPARGLRQLAAYEGPAYHLRRVSVRTRARRLPARAWIAPGGLKRSWIERRRVP
jgi:gamma-glutamylcyclotransferase (GGCT)/AIG2-like uncharacterized protein YtfP